MVLASSGVLEEFGAKAARSIPAEKTGPVEEITMALALALSSMSAMAAGSCSQKAGIMLFRFSGLFRTMWATFSSILMSKQSYLVIGVFSYYVWTEVYRGSS